MTKFKSLIALCILVAIVTTCALSAAASITSTTTVHWTGNETEAWAKTVGYGPENTNYYVKAWIRSTSTNEYESHINYSLGSGSATATTKSVTVTYPSEIPLVEYGGSHGY